MSVQVTIGNTTITLNGSEAEEMKQQMIDAGYYDPDNDSDSEFVSAG